MFMTGYFIFLCLVCEFHKERKKKNGEKNKFCWKERIVKHVRKSAQQSEQWVANEFKDKCTENFT